MKSKKAILYTRIDTSKPVSDRRHSIACQEEDLVKYCLINNVDIIAIYKEVYSGRTFQRPEFIKMLSFLREKRSEVDLLLFVRWDRFSRNAAEAYDIISQLQELGVEAKPIEAPLDINISKQELVFPKRGISRIIQNEINH